MLKKIFEKTRKMITVDKYYKMNDAQPEAEARKWNIGEYIFPTGISRQVIISALLKKDKANNSRSAILISIIALIISIIALLK